ncbi:toll/interleukin-1 receptor domain-containing protein [Hufsiella ginkgonis]|uniref:TIR domain-containing protein n=1 Tax=Hufsiella ginkgonis TaxID=2695274 RepID=A0A7K1XVH6_9SPHI|nr:toll/interleukin-1 receptor domain-containing protein [Hufsiella ginkgonis]MXV14807.1 TIR domain-containing protein [Hufsiella ginkgonis]
MMMNYTYDIAISFAEEDRNAAVALALALEAKGLNPYYYAENLQETAGHSLDKRLCELYFHEARFAAVLLSPTYFKKRYTQIELGAMIKRISENPEEVYLIPICLTHTDLSSYPQLRELGFIDWNNDPKRIAKIMKKMLGKKLDPPNNDTQCKLLNKITQKIASKQLLKIEKESTIGNISQVTNNTQNYGGK